jgi:hypothetical protein
MSGVTIVCAGMSLGFLCFVVSHTLVQLQKQLQWNLLSNGLVGVYSLKTHAFASIGDVDNFFAEVVYPENYILRGL